MLGFVDVLPSVSVTMLARPYPCVRTVAVRLVGNTNTCNCAAYIEMALAAVFNAPPGEASVLREARMIEVEGDGSVVFWVVVMACFRACDRGCRWCSLFLYGSS